MKSKTIDNYVNEPLTDKQIELFNELESQGLQLWANEDKMTAWYVKDGKKVRIPYGTYLTFWFKRLLQSLTEDGDNCIFSYSLIHQ